ncbi:hypothetical protein ACVVIH_13015 [Chryseobacterium arthrosphaerae]
MAEGEKTLREIQEAKSHIEHQVSELIKEFTKKFPQVEIHLKVDTSYMDIKTTKLETEKRFCKVDVKAYVTV